MLGPFNFLGYGFGPFRSILLREVGMAKETSLGDSYRLLTSFGKEETQLGS